VIPPLVIVAGVYERAATFSKARREARRGYALGDCVMMGALAMSDFEVNSVGTADELTRFRADSPAQQIARLTCALMLN